MVFPASQVSRKIRISSMEETANKVLKRVRIFICPNTVQKKEQNIYAWKKKVFRFSPGDYHEFLSGCECLV